MFNVVTVALLCQDLVVWNSLRIELRAPDISLTVFRNKLKTYLFDIT